MELATLCGIKACTVCFGPNGVAETWPKDPSEVKSVVEEYFSGYGKDRRGKKESSVEEEVGAVAVAVEKRDWSDDNWLMRLSRDCLTKFLKDLGLKLQVVRAGIEFLNHQQDNQDAVMHETPEIIRSGYIGGSGGLSVSVWFESDPFDLEILAGGGSGGLRCGSAILGGGGSGGLRFGSGSLPVSVCSDSDSFDLRILGGGGSGGLRCGSGSFPVSVCSNSDSFDLGILGGGGSSGLPVSVCSDSDSLDLAILGGGGSDGLSCGSGGLPVSVCSDFESGGLTVSVCSDSDSFDLAIFGGGGSGGLPVSVFSNSDPFDLVILGGGGSGGLHVWSNSDPSNLVVLA
ncbi:hypothetical protein U1Q18_005126 [Sarracenia purpurea var. burkii]